MYNIIRLCLITFFIIIILMIVNHFYLSRKNKFKSIGLDKTFLNWSIDNKKSGYMSIILKYNCTDESFRYLIDNIINSIKLTLNKKNSIINRQVDYNNKNIITIDKGVFDIISFKEEYFENNFNKFYQKNLKESIFFLISKKKKNNYYKF